MADEEPKDRTPKKAETPKPGASKPAAKGSAGPSETKRSERPQDRLPKAAPKERPHAGDVKSAAGSEKPRETKEKARDEEEEEEDEVVRKPKPDLSREQSRLLKLRKEASGRRPRFFRQDAPLAYRLARTGWHKPRGLQSRTRQHEKGRVNVVSVGYRGPVDVRALHPSGFREVLVASEKDLKGLDPKVQAVRIRAGVGRRRRETLEEAADDLGLWVLNRKMEHYVVRVKDPSQIVELGLTAKGDRMRPGGDAILIDPSVADNVRDDIIAEAEDRGIRVLNPGAGRG